MTGTATPGPLDPSHLRDAAHELCDLADAMTMPAFRGALDVREKSDGTWVTQIDTEVERTLRAAIRSRFPGHAVLGEEHGREGPQDAPTWIIDPIDGTTNYVKGNPVFATLVAVQVDGREVAGVVSAPALGTRWDGVRGGPARQDGREVRVSSIASIADAEVAFGGLGYFRARGLGRAVDALVDASRRQRGYGDFWQHCLVASGSTDVAIEAEVSVWDLAAVKIVVEAAGGTFSDLRGTVTAGGGDALSTNGLLHQAVLDVLETAGADVPHTT